MVVNEPIGALAQLGLAQAFVKTGDIKKARESYEKFFVTWKDADGDIPVYHQAQSDYQSW